ncbi:polymer-forming cytoskeletal protein [Solidesulfovibrio sp.]|uniref:bactofilin family protein n=1 Tax=Solidesulfovibrio sp. TaxID=2910990 RepID=UPI002636EFF4|nr:polymer-forming cytoskeletal protein [Solidesulfovibrio sp.]
MGKHDINAFLGAGTYFTGRLVFEGVVRLDGCFDGEIASSGTLIVGKNARLTGQVAVGRLSCGGSVTAEVTAASKVTITSTGRLTGSVRTPALVVEEGGCLDGEVVMEASAAVAAPVVESLPQGGGEPQENNA